jgi:hypothetical protein
MPCVNATPKDDQSERVRLAEESDHEDGGPMGIGFGFALKMCVAGENARLSSERREKAQAAFVITR